jgi:hypothetical protein
MGKAFVAKLAKEGARDPEALAAWIGRKKHGTKAFAQLAAKGRKEGGASSSPSSSRPPQASADRLAATTARAPLSDQRAKEEDQNTPSGFTAEEEQTLEAAKAQTAKMDMGQLQEFEAAYRPGSNTSAGRTRADDLRHEAVRREIERRHDLVQKGMDEVRKLNRGADQGSFMMGRRPEGVDGMRLRRMSDEKVNQNLALVLSLSRAVEDNGTRISRTDNALLYGVASALRRENRRRNLPPVR